MQGYTDMTKEFQEWWGRNGCSCNKSLGARMFNSSLRNWFWEVWKSVYIFPPQILEDITKNIIRIQGNLIGHLDNPELKEAYDEIEVIISKINKLGNR